MSQSYLTSIVEDRWKEAVANPSIPRWKTLAGLAAQIADAIEDSDPNSIMVVAHRAVYEESYKRMLAMQPKEVTA